MSKRTLEQLNINKQKKVTVSNGYPNPTQGTNGEIQIRITKDNGPLIFVRANNRWYSTPLNYAPIGKNRERVVLKQGRDAKLPGELALSSGGDLTYKLAGDIDAVTLKDWSVDQGSSNLHADNVVITHDNVTDFDTVVDGKITTGVNNLIDSAPGALNTLNELAAALGDDENFSTTVTNTINRAYGTDLITNGTFASDANWTKGTGWSIGSGVASCDAPGNWSALQNNAGGASNTVTIGKTYIITFDMTRSAGFIQVKTGTTHENHSSAGSKVTIFTATGTTWYFTANADFVGTIDNVVLKEVLVSPLDLTVDGGGTVHANNYTNTTYTVGDGGLTQNNFTNTLKSKLDGVEEDATADQTKADINALDITELGTITSGTWQGTAIDKTRGGFGEDASSLSSSIAELNKLDGYTGDVNDLNILDGVTTTTSELNILDGVTSTTAELNKLDGFTGVADDLNYAKDLRATGVTTSELDILDGITSTTSELNILDGVTSTTSELNILDGVTSTTSELNKLDGFTGSATELNYAKDLYDTGVTSSEFDKLDGLTATTNELNIMDGVTAGTSELNVMDGITSTTGELNKLDGFTGTYEDLNYAKDLKAEGVTTTEFNILDGLTSSTSELNIMDGVTSTTNELNILDGVTSTTAELNKLDGFTGDATDLNYAKSLYDTGVSSTEFDYLDGVTSNIQTQMNAKLTSGEYPNDDFALANNTVYFRAYGSKSFEDLLRTARSDLIRHQTPTNIQYWDFSAGTPAWTTDPGAILTGLKLILDGTPATEWLMPQAYRKIRFEIDRNSAWANAQTFMLQTGWTQLDFATAGGNGNTMHPSVTIEQYNDIGSDADDTWTYHASYTPDFSASNSDVTINNWGTLLFHRSSGMHMNDKKIRLTIEFPAWDDSDNIGSNSPPFYVRIRNIGLFSWWAGFENVPYPLKSNFNKDLIVGYSGDGVITSNGSNNLKLKTGNASTGNITIVDGANQDIQINPNGSGKAEVDGNLSLKNAADDIVIDSATVLSKTVLGSGVVSSSLTTVGTITTGTWNGTAIDKTRGGFGEDASSLTSTISELNILDGVTATTSELNIMDGVTSTTAELNKLDGFTGAASDLNYAKDLNAEGVTASEFNILDGLTSTTSELNILDGVTSTTSELNILDGVTSTTAELNKLDGFTGDFNDLNYAKDLRAEGVTTSEFNILDGLTASTSELNIMDGVTSTASELNILDGVTSTTAELNKLDGFTGTFEDLNYAKDLRDSGVTISELDTLDGYTGGATELNYAKDLYDTGVTSSEFDKLDGLTATTSELNIMDGVTATTGELNIMDGVTSTTGELNKLDGFTGTYEDLNYAKDLKAEGVTASEFDILDGLTSTTSELNILDGVTSSTSELNILDGVTSTTAEINKLDGFTGVAADLNFAKDLRATGVTTSELDILDGITATTSELNILDGVTSTATEINKLDGFTGDHNDLNFAKDLRATGVTDTEFNILDGLTASTSELNIMDGVTATTSELNIIDGLTASTSELNIMDGVTATASELNIIDGVTASTSELNIMDGVTATTSELNKMDGVTATTTELNYMDGVTSAVQTQITAKANAADPAFTGTLALTGASNINITGADDSAANLNLKGGLNNGAASISILPDKGDDNADCFKIIAEDATVQSGLRFQTKGASGYYDMMAIIQGGNTAADGQIGIYSPLICSSTVQAVGFSDGSTTIVGFVDEDDMSSNSATKLPTQQSVKTYIDGNIKDIDWTVPTGGYLRSGNTTRYTQTYQGDETWGNSVSLITSGITGITTVSYSDVVGGIWVAPAAAKVTKCNMVVRNISYADDLTIQLWAVNPANLQATLLFDHDITIPNTTSIVAVNESISSSNTIAEGYVLLATIQKQSSSGTGFTYFNWTVSGIYQ